MRDCLVAIAFVVAWAALSALDIWVARRYFGLSLWLAVVLSVPFALFEALPVLAFSGFFSDPPDSSAASAAENSTGTDTANPPGG